jgi:TfoX/Sxy family transcriptional regulator of competence genes
MAKSITPQARFERLINECLAFDGVTPPSPGGTFGSTALKCHNKIFAMLVRDHLVLKLPRKRVDELVAAGEGERFDANKGKPMKEWLVLGASSKLSWSDLAHEAIAFVGE